MMTTNAMTAFSPDDAELVAGTLSGDRNAFTQIVSRYQSLICSLAYSATGSLSQSEDLAQETFITAWKHLRQLRERHKLKAWLCGIARNRINNCLRREGREPLREAESLEVVHESAAPEPLPHDHVISKEEENILWRSLERIPLIYREPLILFYREHCSIENVAASLDLTGDAVKQRLSRGRKLLAEEVSAFVEGALERTNPGRAFTLGVIAALPVVLSTSAKAAMLGAAAAKGTAAAKTAASIGFLNAIFGSLLGFIGPWLQYRVYLAAATSDEERASIKRYYRRLLALMIGFGSMLLALLVFGGEFLTQHPFAFAIVLITFVTAYVVAAVRMGIWANRLFRELREKKSTAESLEAEKPAWEYRSAWSFLGLPLVHIRMHRSCERRSPVKAWVAVGDSAIGGLFAFGGAAFAPISIGGLAVGLISFGGAAVGLFSLGGFALGGWSFGGFALGWQSFGGCALALNAAKGGLAVARDFALGGQANAAQVNNQMATDFMNASSFFQYMEILARHIAWLNLLWIIPLTGWWRVVAKANAVKRVDA